MKTKRVSNTSGMPNPQQPAQEELDRPIHYEIRVRGHLDARWADWFQGLTITPEADGMTVLAGPVADQAALHGLLRKVRDLALPLISVQPAREERL